jgi:hypothetical protein
MKTLEFNESEPKIKQFLTAIFGNVTGYIEIRFIDGGILSRYYSSVKDISLDEIDSWRSQSKRNIFFGVCARREKQRTKESVCCVTTLWADLDNKDFVTGSAKQALNLLPDELSPSCVVNSGHGIHCYWFLDKQVPIKTEQDIEHVEGYVLGLANLLNGDKVQDLSRIMRMPGTLNCKDPDNPIQTEFLTFYPNIRYSLAHFDKYWTQPLSADAKKISFAAKLPKIDVERLNLSNKIKELIESGFTPGCGYDSRSNADQAVITALLGAGYSADEVKAIFTSYAIGEKYREKGRWGDSYLRHSIAKARTFLDQQPQRFRRMEVDDAYAPAQTLRELLSSVETTTPLIENLLRRGDLLMIFAPSGTGKSIYAENLAAYACAGESVFGIFPVSEPLRCLYVDFEMPEDEAANRFDIMFEALSKGEEHFRIKCFADFDITEPRGKKWLIDNTEKFKPDILILDPLESMHHRDENDAKEMGLVIQPLREISKDYGCAVVIVHHARAEQYDFRGKPLPRKARGSTILINKMDTVLELMSTDKQDVTKLHFAKARRVAISRREDLVFDYSHETLLLSPVDDPKMREHFSRLNVERQHALEPYLRIMRLGYTHSQIAEKLGVHRSTISRYMSGIRTPPADEIAKAAKIARELEQRHK